MAQRILATIFLDNSIETFFVGFWCNNFMVNNSGSPQADDYRDYQVPWALAQLNEFLQVFHAGGQEVRAGNP